MPCCQFNNLHKKYDVIISLFSLIEYLIWLVDILKVRVKVTWLLLPVSLSCSLCVGCESWCLGLLCGVATGQSPAYGGVEAPSLSHSNRPERPDRELLPPLGYGLQCEWIAVDMTPSVCHMISYSGCRGCGLLCCVVLCVVTVCDVGEVILGGRPRAWHCDVMMWARQD